RYLPNVVPTTVGAPSIVGVGTDTGIRARSRIPSTYRPLPSITTPKKGGSPQASNRKESPTRRGRKGREHVVPFAKLALPTLYPRWPDWRISVSVEVVGRAAESQAPLPGLFDCQRRGGGGGRSKVRA